MAITNTATITAADINAMVTTALGLIQTDNAQLPGGLELNLHFNNVVGGGSPTSAERRKAVFVAPFDLYVETVAIQTGNFTNPSSVTVTVTGDGGLQNHPLTATSNIAAGGIVKGTRILYNNAKTKAGKSFITLSQTMRVFTKGETITVTVSTTSTATPSTCLVQVVMREFFARE